ncbi:MAG TPA: CCA tRNA nucleotidyltransferase, partial [Stellaceae bacterium]|nr:CCA tRNA nucleotidyltransferase [Stellaceae bacterium]
MPDERELERIAPPPWMSEDATLAVLAALGPGAARFVGGPVRDSILGRPVLDIDIATTHRPEAAMKRLRDAGIAVVPTGLKHGTVTAVMPPRRFEITSLRRDVETFGRHARVEFCDDWVEDARRRDFTMNALFLDAEGRIFDSVGGLADLRSGRVRFVGDAERRIREDVLRLLRFYRFHAHYGRGAADAEARAAARALAHSLPRLSAERVRAELLKLLAAPDPVPTLALMREDGVLPFVLPEARGFETLAALVALEDEADPVRRLGALAAADSVADRLKLKNADRARLAAFAARGELLPATDARSLRRALYRLGTPLFRDLVLLAGAATGDPATARAGLRLAAEWRAPRFPLKGRDLAQRGVTPGPELGRLLKEIES